MGQFSFFAQFRHQYAADQQAHVEQRGQAAGGCRGHALGEERVDKVAVKQQCRAYRQTAADHRICLSLSICALPGGSGAQQNRSAVFVFSVWNGFAAVK